MLSVALVGPADVDLDLAVTSYDANGNSILSLGGYSSGSVETVSSVLPEAGLYEVESMPAYTDQDGAFFIRASLDDPRFFGGQWATDATASSQYGDPEWAAPGDGSQRYRGCRRCRHRLGPAEADAGEQTLELVYDYPVVPAGVAIVESYNPGAVVKVEVWDIDSGEWVTLYEGDAAPTEEAYRVFRPTLASADFKTDSIRLTLDTAAVPGWNEIDAVQLFGRP